MSRPCACCRRPLEPGKSVPSLCGPCEVFQCIHGGHCNDPVWLVADREDV